MDLRQALALEQVLEQVLEEEQRLGLRQVQQERVSQDLRTGLQRRERAQPASQVPRTDRRPEQVLEQARVLAQVRPV